MDQSASEKLEEEDMESERASLVENFMNAVEGGQNAVLSTALTVDILEIVLPDDIKKWDKDTTKRVLEKALDLCAISTRSEKKTVEELEIEQEKIKQQIEALEQRENRNEDDLWWHQKVKGTQSIWRGDQINNLFAIDEIEISLQRDGLEERERAELENRALRCRETIANLQNQIEAMESPLKDDDDTRKRESDVRHSDGVTPAKKARESVKSTTEDVLEYVVLVAEGQKFKVSKKKLMEKSGFFMAMFSNDYLESNMTELPQPDKTAADIELFLMLLDQEDCLNEENIFSAVEVARFYQAEGILDACEKWLVNDTKIDKNDKFQLADHYNLDSLKKNILDNIPTVLGIQEILPENTDAWTKDTMTSVLQKILGFFGIPKSTEKRTVREVEAEQRMFLLQIDAFQRKMKENSGILEHHDMVVRRRDEVTQLLEAKRDDIARLEEILSTDDLDDSHREGLKQKREEAKQNADGMQKELDELDFPLRID